MSKKKPHIITDPVHNARYMRRHADKMGLVPKKSAIKHANESFLDKKYEQQ